MSKKFRVVMTLVLISSGVPAVRAQQKQGDEKKGDEQGKPVVFTMPTTYKTAVAEIELRLHEISESIENKRFDKVHAGAHVIQKVAQTIGQLALKEGSGVPKEALKDINLTGTDLAAKFDAIDMAGKSGDLAATKKVYAEMVAATATLQKYVPKVYQCPMKCEKEKTYDKPGKCPKCGMDVEELKSHVDHKAKHGGVSVMAPDQKHFLEGTLSANNEFRIYFYDEYTKPISADKFTVAAKAWNKGAGESDRKPVDIALGSDESFLTGRVDTSVKAPLSIKVFIDFKDGQKPQMFDFDFSVPSKDPSNENKDEREKGHGGH